MIRLDQVPLGVALWPCQPDTALPRATHFDPGLNFARACGQAGLRLAVVRAGEELSSPAIVPWKFIELSRDNLYLAKQVVDLMNEKGVREPRASGTHRPELAALTRDCIMQAK